MQQPAEPADADWAFLVLPATASARLPSRGQVTVDATLAGHGFQVTLDPDGAGGHWMRLAAEILAQTGAQPREQVALTLVPVATEPEPVVPDDVRHALDGHPAAQATWRDITPAARRDWVHWITSGKKAETRVKRLGVACDKLAAGQRRACCFDRSGQYSKGNMGPPPAK